MSEKKSKQDRKMKLMTEEADKRKVADEMAASIRKMIEDRDKKAQSAKEHLVAQLDVTSDKYRTANGVMAALDTVRTVAGSHSDMSLEEEIGMAKAVATEMAKVAADMKAHAQETASEELDIICEIYDADFSQGNGSGIEMVKELMVLQLCQNVGPDAQDVVDFCKTADEEIEKTREDLRKHCEENGLDFLEICGEKEDLTDLCDSCGNSSCHNGGGKFIKQGQSAYDVCKDFAE